MLDSENIIRLPGQKGHGRSFEGQSCTAKDSRFISDLSVSVDLDICCGRHVAADAIQFAILPCYHNLLHSSIARIASTALHIQDAVTVQVLRRRGEGATHY